jgi:malate dehydrogenase (quinone)
VVPTYGHTLNGNTELTQHVWDDTAATLQLTKPPVIKMPAQEPAQSTITGQAEKTPAQHDMAL